MFPSHPYSTQLGCKGLIENKRPIRVGGTSYRLKHHDSTIVFSKKKDVFSIRVSSTKRMQDSCKERESSVTTGASVGLCKRGNTF